MESRQRPPPFESSLAMVNSQRTCFFTLLLCFVCFPGASASGKTDPAADAAWEKITEMDKGPQATPKNRMEAATRVRDHLLAHQELVERFIADFPQDQRQFEARLRQAALISSRATLEGDRHGLQRAYRLLSDLERARNLTRQQAADATFQRISVLFLQARGQEERMIEAVVNAATNFHSRYPNDGRGPRLLVEAASICDHRPRTKRALLETALRDTREEPLKARIRDDLRRVDLLGQSFEVNFPTLDGNTFQLSDHRGKVVVLVFWAADSPHSLIWMQSFVEKTRQFASPNSRTVVASLSMDDDRAELVEMARELKIGFPIGFEGEGWQGETARRLGINALPTVWVFDKKGRLRVINARDNYESVIRQLESE